MTVWSLSTASALAVSIRVGSDCASPVSTSEGLTFRHTEYFTLGSFVSFLFRVFFVPQKLVLLVHRCGSQIVLTFSPPQKNTVLHLCGFFPLAKKRMTVGSELKISDPERSNVL